MLQISPGEDIYAQPRHVEDLSECYFYHTIDLPGYGVQHGEWDLRAGADAYLGHYSFAGKRVLEVGTANGFLCFHMESKGADVVAYDLSDRNMWDLVPFASPEFDYEAEVAKRKEHTRRINNAWWLAHRLLESKAKVVYGTAYEIPDGIGEVDVATFGSILEHLRDPFQALSRAARLVKDALIITDVPLEPEPLNHLPMIQFVPRADSCRLNATWWQLSPLAIAEFVRILGFPVIEATYHTQSGRAGTTVLYTIVARRG
jgi:SAM-dependent methyltransferase